MVLNVETNEPKRVCDACYITLHTKLEFSKQTNNTNQINEIINKSTSLVCINKYVYTFIQKTSILYIIILIFMNTAFRLLTKSIFA